MRACRVASPFLTQLGFQIGEIPLHHVFDSVVFLDLQVEVRLQSGKVHGGGVLMAAMEMEEKRRGSRLWSYLGGSPMRNSCKDGDERGARRPWRFRCWRQDWMRCCGYWPWKKMVAAWQRRTREEERLCDDGEIHSVVASRRCSCATAADGKSLWWPVDAPARKEIDDGGRDVVVERTRGGWQCDGVGGEDHEVEVKDGDEVERDGDDEMDSEGDHEVKIDSGCASEDDDEIDDKGM
ncbi:hypothetical protein LR48_Vigan02g027000 [Vigna angularis]|uniref:Uncharacterized protein n=1 Tax=Phaseolus angularis TaxID=3914 RepID=A0A0L9TU92_PHAAN|nr:hypothetical protein LR48_Vigan02g027000 [Vigna angularis]